MRSKINRIGFEIEGEFAYELTTKLERIKGCKVGTDGSVRCQSSSREPREFRSGVLKVDSPDIDKIFRLFDSAYQAGEYNYNSSAGFHIHVSFKPQRPPEILSFMFYKWFMENLSKEFPEVIPARIKGTYCKAVADDKEVYRGTDRYRAINFQPALSRHGTIEFRIFPSNKPAIMMKYLQFTLEQIKIFTKRDLLIDGDVELSSGEIFEQAFRESAEVNLHNENISEYV